MKRISVSFILIFLFCGGSIFAQQIISADTTRRIPGGSTLAFINFSPDARSGALGEAGVALSPDANATFWNGAKLAFAENDFGAAVSYTPWLRNLTDDMWLTYLTGYKKINKTQALGLSLNYNNNGTIDLRNNNGDPLGDFTSKEFAIAGTYSAQLARNFSVGLTLKYIRSNLAGTTALTPFSMKPASTAAGDISVFYKKGMKNETTGRELTWAFGGMISNLGGKVSYGGNVNYFIPTNLKIGTGLTYSADGKSKFNFLLDLNKLMVPTPPVWEYNATTGQPVVVRGRNPETTPVLAGIFGSFGDAPDGISEELAEVMVSAGVEYSYNNFFAARLGYFNESKRKGDRKYFTAGVGLNFHKNFGADFAYLMPVSQGNLLAQTLRLTLSMRLNKADTSFEE